jgi:hypothetical protein
MKGAYRKFSVAAQLAIIERASSSGAVCCERCGEWCPKREDFEIDHILAEGMRPAEDLKRPLVAADGQLLCLECHDKKTDVDKGRIALAVRREAYAKGVERPGKKKMRKRRKEPKPAYKPAAGEPRLAREGFISARGVRQ